MPNHVINKVEFFGTQKNINEIMDKNKGEAVAIDFETIIPMPKNIYRGELGQKEREIYGTNNWYDWSVSHWGTKWNAYHQETNGNIIYFQTAWSMPEPIYQRLAEICDQIDVRFEGSWCNEDWSADSGSFYSDNGAFYVDYDETEEEHRQKCIELWGWNPTDDTEFKEEKQNEQ